MHSTVFERHAPPAEAVEAALAGSVNRSFWLDDLPERRAFPELQGGQQADLAIVGGGFLGLWAAVMAKERDPSRSVALFEAKSLGWAASGRCGGFCEASLTHGDSNGRRRWPEEMSELDQLALENLDEFEQTLARYNIDCDFERTGLLEVAVEPYQVAELQGPGYLTQEEVRRHVDSPTFLAGNWDREGCALLHPAKLVAGLMRVADQLGVRIFENSPVRTLSARSHAIELSAAAGSLTAAQVLLATNVFPSLLRRYRMHTVPVYDYVLMTEPLSDAQLNSIGWRNRQGLADTANQFHYYRLTKQNRIMFGGYDALYFFGGKMQEHREDRAETHRKLASHFLTTFPQLKNVRFTHRWAGVIDTSTRFCSFFGQAHGGRVQYAAGFTGLGVAATRFAANVMLDRAEGKETHRTSPKLVREVPIPFPPEPFAFASIQAARWALDRADHNEGKRNLLLRTLDALGFGFNS